MLEVQLFPLVHHVPLPKQARAKTRTEIPPGYGVQEHCLPFTAASALGLLIESPISFGLCLPNEVPHEGHAFPSSMTDIGITGKSADERVFYVLDNPRCHFERNAFTLDELAGLDGNRIGPLEPGISFFERIDQQDLFKLHLPYIWRTPQDMDTLFLPVINRAAPGFSVLSGLVETDWYAHPVNLVLRKPQTGSVHVVTGDPIAQVIFMKRAYRRPTLKVLAYHARMARNLKNSLLDWYRLHAQNRSAYKKLARSHYGRVDEADRSPNKESQSEL